MKSRCFLVEPIIIAIFLVFFNTKINAERKCEKKCKEYGQLVYVKEESPVLRINAGKNNVTKCGIVGTKLIIGGTKAEHLEFPHMAVIGYGNPILWQCGGTIISENYILTAAHCLDDKERGPPLKVRVGLLHLKNPEPEMQERNIVERLQHPKYVMPLKYHDIALLKLEKSLEMGPAVRPACLDVLEKPPEKSAIACGFGRTVYEIHEGSDNLLKVSLDYVESEECKKLHGKELDGRLMPQGLTSDMICAGSPEGGKDTCQGDSGGPLQRVLQDPYCTYGIVGITSFGKFCGYKGSPAVYTRVKSYLDWIEKIVWP